MYAVILAGGGGTRLWPLSSPERPKPFLPLLGGGSLLELTVERVRDLVLPWERTDKAALLASEAGLPEPEPILAVS